MMSRLLESLLPLLLSKVGEASLAEKRTFAGYVSDLAVAFVSDDREKFESLLCKTEIPVTYKAAVVRALWKDANQSK